MPRVPYLQRRDNGVYYLQVRLPALTPLASRFLLRISLGTRDFLDARQKVIRRLEWVVPLMSTYSLKSRMDEVSARLACLASLPVLNAEQMAGRVLFEHAGRHVMQEINRGLPDTPPPEGFPNFCELWTAFVQGNITMERASKDRDLRVSYETGRRDQMSANALLAGTTTWAPDLQSAAAAPVAPDDAAAVSRLDATLQVPDDILTSALATGYDTARPEIFIPTPSEVPSRPPVPSTSSAHVPKKTTAKRVYPKRTKLLSDWVREFLIYDAAQRNNHNADREVRPYVEFMIALLGDRPLKDYSFDDFDTLNIAMCQIPERYGVPNKHRDSLKARYDFAREHGWEGLEKPVTTTVMDRYGSALNRFFRWLKERKNIVVVRPTWTIHGDLRGPLPRDSFTDEEAHALFSMPLFTGHDEHDRWKPGPFLTLSGVYYSFVLEVVCGLRPSESAQVGPGDLKEIEGFMYFDMRPFDPADGRVLVSQMKRFKSDNASRFVIAPPLLGDIAFFELAKSQAGKGRSRILSDIKPKLLSGKDEAWGAALSRDWQARKKILDFKRKNVSAYSGRHLLKDLLQKLGVSEPDQERMMGHAVSSVSRGYGNKRVYDPDVAARIYGADTPLLRWLRETLVGAYERAKAAGTLIIPDVDRS